MKLIIILVLLPIRCNDLAESIAATYAMELSARFIGSKAMAICVYLTDSGIKSVFARQMAETPLGHLGGEYGFP